MPGLKSSSLNCSINMNFKVCIIVIMLCLLYFTSFIRSSNKGMMYPHLIISIMNDMESRVKVNRCLLDTK